MEKMLTRRHAIEQAGEEGFTVVELLIVMEITAILLIISIPTFLGAISSAGATQGASQLWNASVNESEMLFFSNGVVPASSSGQTTLIDALQHADPGSGLTYEALPSAQDGAGTSPLTSTVYVWTDSTGLPDAPVRGGTPGETANPDNVIIFAVYVPASQQCDYVVISRSEEAPTVDSQTDYFEGNTGKALGIGVLYGVSSSGGVGCSELDGPVSVAPSSTPPSSWGIPIAP